MLNTEVITMEKSEERLAKFIRIMSAPPFMAIVFVLILYYSGKDIVTNSLQLWSMIICLGILPVLAYPISAVFHMSRAKQRYLAIGLSFISYGALCILSYTLKWNNVIKLLSLTYLLSSICLIIFNKDLCLKASGHACAITGPGVMTCFLVNLKYIPPCLLIYLVILWASVKTKRHSIKEYLLGSACFIIASISAKILVML